MIRDHKQAVLDAMAKFQGRVDAGKVAEPRPTKAKRHHAFPTEYAEQGRVCDWLKLMKVLYAAIPNGAYLSGSGSERGIRWRQMARIGAKVGVPDLVIFTPPPTKPASRVAVEMKRVREAKPRLSDEQQAWHTMLAGESWIVVVGYGADDAIEKLTELGYGR